MSADALSPRQWPDVTMPTYLLHNVTDHGNVTLLGVGYHLGLKVKQMKLFLKDHLNLITTE